MTHAVRRFGRALLLVVVPALALASPNFERRWHWYMSVVGRSAAQLPDGGYIISGGMQVTTGSFGVVLARTNDMGDTTRVRQIQNVDPDGGLSCRLADGGYALLAESSGTILARKFGPAGDSAWDYRSAWRGMVWAVVPTFDGGCLVAGRIPDTAYDMGAIKLAADGREEWARTYDEPRMFDSRARGAAQTRDSGYILCGDANDYTSANMRLARLRPNGDSVWTRLYHGPVGPALSDVREMADGGFFAVGFEYDTAATHDALYMMRTDSIGDTIWTRHLSPPGAATQAAAMCATRDGGFMIAGSIDWGDSARAWLVKTDANCDTMWTRAVGGPWRENAADIEQTADGGYIIAGTSEVSGGRMLAIKTDSLGRVGVEEGRPGVPARAAFSVTPNPCHSSTTISCSSSLLSPHSSLSLYDVTGRLVLVPRSSFFVPRSSSFRLDLRSMPAGVYLVKLDYEGGSATRKLVVE
jgi:hypothetical protein